MESTFSMTLRLRANLKVPHPFDAEPPEPSIPAGHAVGPASKRRRNDFHRGPSALALASESHVPLVVPSSATQKLLPQLFSSADWESKGPMTPQNVAHSTANCTQAMWALGRREGSSSRPHDWWLAAHLEDFTTATDLYIGSVIASVAVATRGKSVISLRASQVFSLHPEVGAAHFSAWADGRMQFCFALLRGQSAELHDTATPAMKRLYPRGCDDASAALMQLLRSEGGWVLGRRQRNAEVSGTVYGDESDEVIDDAASVTPATAWGLLDVAAWQALAPSVVVGLRSAAALWTSPGQQLRASVARCVFPRVHPELRLPAHWQEWVSGAWTYSLALVVAKIDLLEQPAVQPLRFIAALDGGPDQADIGCTRQWLVGRRSAPSAALGDGAAVAPNPWAWWSVPVHELQRGTLFLGRTRLPTLMDERVRRLRSPACGEAPHAGLGGIPARREAWVDEGAEFELVLAFPAGPVWYSHQIVLGRSLLSAAPLAGAALVAAAADALPLPRPPLRLPLEWRTVTADSLSLPNLKVGTVTGSTVYSTRGKKLRDAIKGGVLPRPVALLPGAPFAIAVEWTDDGAAWVLAVVNPSRSPTRASTTTASASESAASLREWLGCPVVIDAVVGPHDGCARQWVIGRRPVIAAAAASAAVLALPAPFDWVTVHAEALKHHGIRIGSLAVTTVYEKRGGRIRAACAAGNAGAPCAFLPGAPPAIVELWTDGAQEWFFALIHPSNGRLSARAGSAESVIRVPVDAAGLVAWLGQLESPSAPLYQDVVDLTGWKPHQWVLAWRLSEPIPATGAGPAGHPEDVWTWTTVTANTLSQHGIPMGSVGTRTVYLTRGMHLRVAFRDGTAPQPLPALPGSPLAMSEEWLEGDVTWMIALVNPVLHPTRISRPGRAGDDDAGVSGAAAAALRLWLAKAQKTPVTSLVNALEVVDDVAAKSGHGACDDGGGTQASDADITI